MRKFAPQACALCAKDFVPTDPRQIYCPACAKKAKRAVSRVKECALCHELFTTKGTTIFCHACRKDPKKREAMERILDERARAVIRNEKIFGRGTCPVCAREFVKKQRGQVFCSRRCSAVSLRSFRGGLIGLGFFPSTADRLKALASVEAKGTWKPGQEVPYNYDTPPREDAS